MPSPTAQLAGLWDCYLDYSRTYMALRNFSEATRRGYASDLRLFIRYLSEEHRVLTEDQYVRLRAACADHPRERALSELFLQTGLRVSEVASLTLGDLQIPPPRSVGAVSVHGKGRKTRTVSLNWTTRAGRIVRWNFEPPAGPRLYVAVISSI